VRSVGKTGASPSTWHYRAALPAYVAHRATHLPRRHFFAAPGAAHALVTPRRRAADAATTANRLVCHGMAPGYRTYFRLLPQRYLFAVSLPASYAALQALLPTTQNAFLRRTCAAAGAPLTLLNRACLYRTI